MRRRALLAAGGLTLAGIAGCLSSPANSPADQSPTTDRTTASDAASVAVDRVQPGVLWMTYPDAVSVIGDDSQYLYLDFDAGEEGPARIEITLQFDGANYVPMDVRGTRRLWRRREGGYYTDGPSGWLLFELPGTGDASDATLRWPGGEWVLPESARKRLSSPMPSLSVTVDGPETMTVGMGVTLTIRATNEGDRLTRFLAAVDQTDPVYRPVDTVSRPLGAGESVSAEIFASPTPISGMDEKYLGDGEADASFSIDWIGGDTDHEVRFVAE